MSKVRGRTNFDSNLAVDSPQPRVARCGVSRRLFAGAASLVALTAAAMCNLDRPAVAGPEDPNVLQGIVGIAQIGNSWFITASNGAVIEYSSFNISAFELVQFLQPGSNSAVLNLIPFSGMPTNIDGSLLSNGVVYIVNPDGVVFGNNAHVNVGGIYAAAVEIGNPATFGAEWRNAVLAGDPLADWSPSSFVLVQSGADLFGNSGVHLLGQQIINHGQIEVGANGVIQMIANNGLITLAKQGENYFVQFPLSSGGPASGIGVYNTGTLTANNNGQIILGASDMYALAIQLEGNGISGSDVNLHVQDLGGGGNHIGLSGGVGITADNLTVTGMVDALEYDDGTDTVVNVAGSLDVNATGAVAFGDSIGTANALDFVTINGATIGLNSVVTSGDQQYTGATTLNGEYITDGGAFSVIGDTTLAGDTLVNTIDSSLVQDGDILFTGEVNSAAAGFHTLNLNAGAGEATFGGAVGSAIDGALGELTATAAQINVNGGSVITQSNLGAGVDGVQTYTGNVVVGQDTTFETVGGDDGDGALRFLGSLSGDTGAENVTLTSGLSTTVTGAIENLQNVDVNEAILWAGSIDIAGNLTASNADVVTTAGAIDVGGAINSNQNVTSFTSVSAGSTDIDGDLTANNGDISVVGHMAAGSAFASGGISAGSAAVTGTTHAAGGNVDVTNDGVFGDTVTASDSVLIGGSATFGGDVTAQTGQIDVAAGVTLTNDIQMQAAGSVMIGGELTGNSHNLTVLTQDVTSFSTITGLGDLVTDAGGSTLFNGQVTANSLDIGDAVTFLFSGSELDMSVVTTGSQTYHGPVTIEADTYLLGSAALGDVAILFNDTIDSANGSHDLSVMTLDGGITFGGDIGSSGGLGMFSAQVGADAVANHANVEAGSIITFGFAEGDDISVTASSAYLNNFLDGGVPVYDNGVDFLHTTFAQIGAFGNLTFNLTGGAGDLFTMGLGQKMTVLGDLDINALGGDVYLGDINTLNDMNITADTIHLLLRPSNPAVDDIGLDFVAGGVFNLIGTIELEGMGGVIFASSNGVVPEGQAGLILTSALDAADLYDPLTGRFLDMKAEGISIEDLSDAIAAEVPDSESTVLVSTQPQITAEQRSLFAEFGLDIRDLDGGELLEHASGRGLFVDHEYDVEDWTNIDPDSKLKRGIALRRLGAPEASRVIEMLRQINDYDTAETRGLFAAVMQAYADDEGADSSLEGVGDWLSEIVAGGDAPMSAEEAAVALERLSQLSQFVDWLEAMGLVRTEVDISSITALILGRFQPDGVSAEQFKQVVQGAAPNSAPAGQS